MNKANDAQKLAFAYLSRSFGNRQSKDERRKTKELFKKECFLFCAKRL